MTSVIIIWVNASLLVFASGYPVCFTGPLSLLVLFTVDIIMKIILEMGAVKWYGRNVQVKKHVCMLDFDHGIMNGRCLNCYNNITVEKPGVVIRKVKRHVYVCVFFPLQLYPVWCLICCSVPFRSVPQNTVSPIKVNF